MDMHRDRSNIVSIRRKGEFLPSTSMASASHSTRVFQNRHTRRSICVPVELLLDERIAHEASLLASSGSSAMMAKGVDDVVELSGVSLNLFPTTSTVRVLVFRAVTSKLFDHVIMALITFSGVRSLHCTSCVRMQLWDEEFSNTNSALAAAVSYTGLSHPWVVYAQRRQWYKLSCWLAWQLLLAVKASFAEEPTGTTLLVYQWLDYALNVLFFVEFVLKVVALGWYNTGPSAYLRSKWNIADFVLLVGSIFCT